MKRLFVLMVAAALVVGCVLPAMAADKEVTFYGRADFNTFWNKDSKEQAPAPNTYSDGDLQWSMERSVSRFGARFKAGDISGNVELRPRNNGTSGDYVRHWYGAWNFGSGTLVVGQTWVPTFQAIHGCCQEGGNSLLWGDMVSTARTPGIQLWFPLSFGTLKIAGLEINTPAANVVTGATDFDTTLPKLEFSLDINKMGPVGLTFFGGYNTYSEVVTATDKEYDVDAWLLGGKVVAGFGPLTFKGLIWAAENTREYGLAAGGHGNPWAATYQAATDSMADSETFAFALAAIFKATDMVSAEIGFARAKHEISISGQDKNEDVDQYFYLSVPINVAKGVLIVPEIYKYDYKDRTTNGVTADEGDRKSVV